MLGRRETGTLWAEGELLYLSAKYSREFVEDCRLIHGRKWDADKRLNIFPMSAKDEVVALAERYRVTVPPELRPMAEDPRSFSNSGYLYNIELVDDKVIILFDYNPSIISAIRSYIPGVRWVGKERYWQCSSEHLGEVAKFANDFRLSIAPEIYELAERFLVEKDILREASSATEGTIDIPNLAHPLLPYQQAGVLYMKKVRKGFIADQPGLGKTVQALATAASEEAYPIVVVCPNTLKLNWKREANKFFPHLNVTVINGTKRQPIEKSDVIVVNYDILFDRNPDIIEHGFKSLIVDESHAIKNGLRNFTCPYCGGPVRSNSKKCMSCMSAPIQPEEHWTVKRTEAVMTLAKMTGPEDFVMLLTGTPITNRPQELVPQLEAVGRLDKFGGAYRFKQRYCPKKHIALNTVELNDKLREMCFVRRLKQDVYGELPPLRNAIQDIEPSAEDMRWYKRVEIDAIEYFAQRARELALEEGGDGSDAYWEKRIRLEPVESLVRLTALREAVAKIKYDSIVSWLDNFLESSDNEKVIVFAEHIDIVEKLHKRYKDVAVKVRGGVSVAKRQEAVDRFQNDEDCRIFIGNMQAASEGLTLTAASDVVFCELGWTPAIHDQCVSRCYGRINDMHGATAWYLLVPSTIEGYIYSLLERKRTVVDSVTDGVELEESSSIVGDLAVELARRGLKK